MKWKIHVLYLGQTTVSKDLVTIALDVNMPLTAPFLAFLLESGSKKILVDTGIHSRYFAGGKGFAGAQQTKGGEDLLLESLKKHKTRPEDIETVLYTHLHNDHAGNCHLFPKALHVFHDAEWNELINPIISMRFRGDFDIEVIPVLEKFRCRRVVGDGEITEGIRFYHTPGHTIGGLTFAVDTSDGPYVIPGDVVNIYQNMFAKMSWMLGLDGKRVNITPAPERCGPIGAPSAIVYDHYAWCRSIWKIHWLLKTPKHLLPNHEPAICGKTFPGTSIDLDFPE